MGIYKNTANVSETSRGWLWREMGIYFADPRSAFKQIVKRNSEICRGTGGSITALTWHTTSIAGTNEIKSLAIKGDE